MKPGIGQRWAWTNYKEPNYNSVVEIVEISKGIKVRCVQGSSHRGRKLGHHDSFSIDFFDTGFRDLGVGSWTYLEGQDAPTT